MMRLAAPLALAGSLAVVTPALAAEPVVIAPARSEGDVSTAVRQTLEKRLVEVVRKSELEVIEVAPELASEAASCEDDACRAKLIADSSATFLLVPDITRVEEDYLLGVTLYGPRGSKSARLEEKCALCGLAEAADVMADIGARIGRKVDVAMRASLVEVRSEPPGAKVFVGDELIGTTPFEAPMDAGTYELRVELDGYIAQRRTIEVVAGEAKELDLGLQPVPVEVVPERDRTKLFTGIGVAALVAGLGAAAGGATMIALDERPIESQCSGTDVDANGNCRWRYSTLEGGIGLVAGGVVLIGTGVALVVVGRKRSRTSQAARVRPIWGGLGLRF